MKYFRGNFRPGGAFVDQQDLREQLAQWQAEITHVRTHGTPHERPADRFADGRSHLIATAGQSGFYQREDSRTAERAYPRGRPMTPTRCGPPPDPLMLPPLYAP